MSNQRSYKKRVLLNGGLKRRNLKDDMGNSILRNMKFRVVRAKE
jgi:hypothetical protein